jgi:protein subunit release factor A
MRYLIEIRAAEGGEDAKLFVWDLADAYVLFAKNNGHT